MQTEKEFTGCEAVLDQKMENTVDRNQISCNVNALHMRNEAREVLLVEVIARGRHIVLTTGYSCFFHVLL